MLKIRLFASLRDIAGDSQLDWDWSGPLTVQSLFETLAERFPRLQAHRGSLLVAVNEQYSAWDRQLSDGDEVAFFPPVSGGAP